MTRRPTKHISTLRDLYWSTNEGKRLLSLIDYHLPEIYVELHCYARSGYDLLMDPDRRKKRGVPPLIEVEEKVLIGSSSPYLLSRYTFDLCLILEVPCSKNNAWDTLLRLLELLRDSTTRSEAIEKLTAPYPSQIEKAIGLMERCNGGHPAKRRETKTCACH